MHPTVLSYRDSAVVKTRHRHVPPRFIQGLSGQEHGYSGHCFVTAVVLRQRVRYLWFTCLPDGGLGVYRQTEFLVVDDPPVCYSTRLLGTPEMPGELLRERIGGLGLDAGDHESRTTICREVYERAKRALKNHWKHMVVEVEVNTVTVMSYELVRQWSSAPAWCPIEELEMEVYSPEEGEGCGADPEACPVCLDEFVPGREVERLPCGHRFHGECVLRWLETHGSCPMCRSEFRIK